jgi:hypothetical protein
MPISSTLFKNKELPLQAQYSFGLMNLNEQSYASAGSGNFGLRAAGYFAICTGTTLLPDIASTPGTTVLMPASACPLNLRPYVTRCDIDVRGPTAWTGGASAMIQDTNSAPLLFLPANCLRGLSCYTFPDSDTEIPITASVSSYVASTGVVTLGSSALISGAYSSNCVATVIAGTGIGQSELIASNTATTFTPARGAGAWPAGLDSTSVVAVWYWAATGTPTTTTVPFSNASFATNALDNGYNLISVSGNSVGAIRPISANTSTTPTVAYAYNSGDTPVAGDLIQISNESNLLGALDLCVGDKWAAAAPNTGIQVAVASGMSAGSSLRIYLEGFFAA